ncbi:MAG TPA: ACT domain-containing protein [Candidatus Atribacteria bacterium]|nr:ACT domain-containing protein [Candidatus Atribacteria bacterium]HPU08428.1 ACT domain-containing protein [Candidatus Atribacteria bacterium]
MKQISVFLENRPGSLYEVLYKLKEWGVNLRALSLADTAEFGVLRFIVENPGEIVEKLKKENFAATLTEVLAVGVEDRPGGLAEVVGILTHQNISIEYLYAFVSPQEGKAYVVLRVEDLEEAERVLRENHIPILEEIAI